MVFKEHVYSVLLVSASEKFNTAIASLIPESDYWPVTIVSNVGSARRKLLESNYDFVLINTPLPDDFGYRFAIHTIHDSTRQVLLFVKSELYDNIFAKVRDYGILTLSKPTSLQMIAQTLGLMQATSERLRGFAQKSESLEERMNEIRLINHAKWLLIEYLKMTETEAHHYIEKQAMDLRISKRDVASNIIKTYK